jgi:hypothetical protein
MSLSYTGIPPLLNNIAPITNTVSLLSSDATNITNAIFGNATQWAILLNNKPIIVPDSVISIEYRQDWNIADFPMEEGAFQSYNKVDTPFDIRLRVVKGGSNSDRQQFLSDIADAADSLFLLTILTPEVSYPSMNISHYEYRRTADNGLTLLAVDIRFVQIRVTATSSFSNTAAPSGASAFQTGSVLTQTPTTGEQAAIASVLSLP